MKKINSIGSCSSLERRRTKGYYYGKGEDDVLPLKVIEEDGETYLTMIEDDDEFEEVYQAFEERLSDLFFDDERIDEDE